MIKLPNGLFENVPPFIKKMNFSEALEYVRSEQNRFSTMRTIYPRDMKVAANLCRQYLVEKFDFGLPDEYDFPTFSDEERAKARTTSIEAQALMMICHLEDRLNVSRQYEGGLESLIDEVTRMKMLDVGVVDQRGRKHVKRQAVVYDYALDMLNEMYARKAV